MTIQTVKLSNLRLSPLNVRKVKPSNIEAMASDIEAHGVLQNLIGYEQDDKVLVCAGGRRYRALKLLQKNKTITGSYEVPVDIRTEAEAIEVSLSENTQREDMHPADAIMAYRALIDGGKEVEDVAAIYGVSPAHVRRILKLSALHPTIMKAFQKDEIGMPAAQAFAMCDDGDRQLEVFKATGDSAHQIRAMLTQDKLTTKHQYFRVVGEDAYTEAGGTFTADLFGEDRYADDPALVTKLLDGALAQIEQQARDEGWQEVEVCYERPDSFYMKPHLDPEGEREPTAEEQAQMDTLADKIATREAECEAEGEQPHWDSEYRALEREQDAIAEGLRFFTDEQKAGHTLTLFLDREGVNRVVFTSAKRSAASDGPKPPRPDYSQKVMDQLGAVRTMAVREAVANDPDLALDVLLDTLIGQLAHSEYSWTLPTEIETSGREVRLVDEIMAHAQIEPIEKIAADDLERVPSEDRLAALRGIDGDTKMRLLAYCVAAQITSHETSGGKAERIDQIGAMAGIDMTAKWEPNQFFYDQLSKPTLFKLLEAGNGKDAIENCAKMKRADLAVTVNERNAGRGILPPVLYLTADPEDRDEREAA